MRTVIISRGAVCPVGGLVGGAVAFGCWLCLDVLFDVSPICLAFVRVCVCACVCAPHLFQTPNLAGWDYCAKELQLPLCDELPPNTPCVDRSENCRMWASGGECDGNPQFMAENCALTCNRCDPGFGQPDPSCVDLDQRCAAFASSGECQRSAPFMNENCPRTCNTCPPAPRPPCLSRSPTMRPTTSPTEQLPLCDTTIPPWERPRCVEPLPPCNIALQLWEQPPCTPAWSPPLRPGQIPVIPSLASQRSGGGGRDIGDSDDE